MLGGTVCAILEVQKMFKTEGSFRWNLTSSHTLVVKMTQDVSRRRMCHDVGSPIDLKENTENTVAVFEDV